jgi:hypothetical protein
VKTVLGHGFGCPFLKKLQDFGDRPGNVMTISSRLLPADANSAHNVLLHFSNQESLQ